LAFDAIDCDRTLSDMNKNPSDDSNDQGRDTSVLREFRLAQQLDKVGDLEEFTSDSSLIVERCRTVHLNDDGLPKVGADVYPGMCLIAKFGATESFDKSKLPNDMESLATDEVTLICKYGYMFYDASLYVPEGLYGLVEHAEFLENDGMLTAIVHVRPRLPACNNADSSQSAIRP
jgi:DNA-directed RNA polymerase beta subunit